MGEEAKQEQAPAPAPPEEKAEEKKGEKPAEEKKEEPKPPEPVVLHVNFHCVGCAKKIERSILRIKGVEGVVIDMASNQVTIKGVVEPQAVCDKIMKKAKRSAKVLSPLPPAEGEPVPEVVASQVPALITVELNVNMHCEACAEQLKKKILKMRGVQSAQTELSSGKVTVTGTMDADKLVEYVYRRTKKQAKIVPQPEPEKPPEEPPKPEDKKENEKPAEETKSDEKKEENAAEQKQGGENDGKEGKGGGEEPQKEGSDGGGNGGEANLINIEDESMKRMMHYYQPLYVIETIPPPQLFSDENPNACCIS